jgi:hypothetical protein
LPAKLTYWTSSRTNPNITGAVISSESLTVGGTSAQSGLTPDNAVYVTVTATEAISINYSGANPTAIAGATGTSAYVAAGERLWLDAVPGYKIAGIVAT